MSTIITRAGKGSPLTSTEVDSNFTNLNTDKVEKAGTDPVSIAVNSASAALRVTQTGAGNAILVEDSTSPDSTPFVVTGDGQVLVGSLTGYADSSATSKDLQIIGVDNATSGESLARFSADTAGSGLFFLKSRGAAIGTQTVVVSGDEIGKIAFDGSNGTAFLNAVLVQAFVDAVPGAADMPGRLVISTSTDGTSTPTEKFRVTNGGVLPFFQPNPTAVNASATLTIAQINTKIITSTTALAVTMTLPTGTLMDGGFSALSTNMGFDWVVINTGATNAITIGAGTAHTVVGNMTVNPLQSATFRSRKTAANTFVTYRIT